jgi:hypothetical protein
MPLAPDEGLLRFRHKYYTRAGTTVHDKGVVLVAVQASRYQTSILSWDGGRLTPGAVSL